MKIQAVKKQLKKINALLQVMQSEEGISSIEKDLLKSYVQKLYGDILNIEVMDGDNQEELDIPLPKPAKAKKKTAKTAQKQKELLSSEPIEPPVVMNQEATDFLADPIEDEGDIAAYVGHTSGMKEEVPTFSNGRPMATDTLVQTKSEVSEPVIDLANEDDKVRHLFMDSKSSELSDKLRNRPLQDINAGLGLNERILMINKLFAGKHDTFKESINKLNAFGSFAEAKKYLIDHLINPLGWTDDSRIEAAASFIHLVRRRHI